MLTTFGTAVSVAREAPTTSTSSRQPASRGKTRPPVYIPPPRGQAAVRVGAATRGVRDDLAHLQALAPDHVGLTVSAQPVLVWQLSERSDVRVDVTVIDGRSPAPLLEYSLNPPVRAGYLDIDLAEHGVTLVVVSSYLWYVALVPNPLRRSHDVIAGGAVRRVEQEVDQTDDPASDYAEQGIWYDAVMALRGETAGGGNPRLEALAAQVGLSAEIR